jgi:hypothetical protein
VGEVSVTALSKYASYFAAKSTNRNAKRILLKDIEPEEEGEAKREFAETHEAVEVAGEFLAYVQESPIVKKELDEAENDELVIAMEKAIARREAARDNIRMVKDQQIHSRQYERRRDAITKQLNREIAGGDGGVFGAGARAVVGAAHDDPAAPVLGVVVVRGLHERAVGVAPPVESECGTDTLPPRRCHANRP